MTERGYWAAYGCWLRLLVSRGRLDGAELSADRATPERIAAYIESLKRRLLPLSVWRYISGLHNVYYRLAPDHDWPWLRDIVNRLHMRVGQRVTSRRHG